MRAPQRFRKARSPSAVCTKKLLVPSRRLFKIQLRVQVDGSLRGIPESLEGGAPKCRELDMSFWDASTDGLCCRSLQESASWATRAPSRFRLG
eukprot:3711795-Pyramimonas_sp.AAC.1